MMETSGSSSDEPVGTAAPAPAASSSTPAFALAQAPSSPNPAKTYSLRRPSAPTTSATANAPPAAATTSAAPPPTVTVSVPPTTPSPRTSHARKPTFSFASRTPSNAAAPPQADGSPLQSSTSVDQLIVEFAAIDDDATTEPQFVKSLQSDLSSADALALFLHLQQSGVADFRDFAETELRMMSDVFSVLSVPSGEKIITKGELASFCGIVLQGGCSAIVSPTLSVDLGPGALVGEMAIFEQGQARSADIVTREDSVLAVLTFRELDSLAATGHHVLQMRLLKMFASASLRKLRTMTSAPPPEPDSSALAVPPPKKAPRTPTASGRTSPVLSVSNTNRESLYLVRMALEKDKDAAHRKAEDERAARLNLERLNLNVGASRDRYKDLASRLKDALQERTEVHTKTMTEVRQRMVAMQREMDATHARHAATSTKLNQEIDGRAAADRASAHALQQATIAHEKVLSAKQVELTAALSRISALDADVARLTVDVNSARAAQAESSSAAEMSLNSLKSTLVATMTTLEEVVAAKKVSDEALKNEMGKASQLSIQLSNLKANLKEMEERAQSSGQLKLQLAELTLASQASSKNSLATIAHLLTGSNTLHADIRRLKTVLKYVTIGCFVKLQRLKKSVHNLHMTISELLVDTLEVSITAAGTQGASQTDISTSNVQSLVKKSLHRKKRDYLLAVEKRVSAGTPPPVATGSFFSSVPHRPRAVARVKIHELVASLEEETYKLRRPFAEVQERSVHWKQCSEAFFARTIALTSVIDEFKKKNQTLSLQNAALKDVLARHNSEYEGVLDANGALKLEIVRFKHEIAAYKKTTRTLEVAADVVGAKKAELENTESRIVLQKAQLTFLQKRYVETVNALQAATASQLSHHASQCTLDASPPKGPPHFPPHPPSAFGAFTASPSMVQLLNATFDLTGSGSPDQSGIPSPRRSAIPLAHVDPELHHIASMRSLQSQAQQQLAFAEYDAATQLQFMLENQPEDDADGNAYSNVFSSRNYTASDPALAGHARGASSEDIPPRYRTRAEKDEEEAKSATSSRRWKKKQAASRANLTADPQNYSSFVPAPTTSELLAPGYTSSALPQVGRSSASGHGSARHNFAHVYGVGPTSPPSTSRHASPPPSARGKVFSQAGLALTSPSSYQPSTRKN